MKLMLTLSHFHLGPLLCLFVSLKMTLTLLSVMKISLAIIGCDCVVCACTAKQHYCDSYPVVSETGFVVLWSHLSW